MTWPTVPLDSVKSSERYSFVGGPFGSELTTRDYVAEGVPVIRGSNLAAEGKFFDDDFVYVSDQKAAALHSNLAYPGDLVFTQRGTLGQVGLIPEEARFSRYVVSQSQMKLTVDEEKAVPLFIYYYFRLPSTVQKIVNRVSSSGVPHINLSTLKDFDVPLPPLAKQRSIVEIGVAYDKLIENNRRRIKLLEQTVRLLYREWFVHFRFPGHEHVKINDGVPEEWKRQPAFDSMEVLSGGTPKTGVPDYWDGEIPFYTPKDSTDSIFVDETEKGITERGLKTCNSALYPAGTVFITARGTVGKINIAGRPMAMNQSCYALVARPPLTQEFLYFAVLSGVEHYRSHAVGSVFNAIIVDTFKHIPFMVPAEPLVTKFSETLRPTLALVANLQAQNRALEKARDLLLPKLMSGELEV